jgi:hypothetical protein
MLFSILADIVIVIHLLWILFLAAGAYWGRRRRAVMLVHGAGLGFAVISQIFGWYCPLTHLEVWLAERQSAARAYPGSFIAHYADRLIYINVRPAIIFVFTLVLVAVNIGIYWSVSRKSRDFNR